MTTVSKPKPSNSTNTSYFIRFKDGVTLPTVLEKQPLLKLKVGNKKEVLTPWEGKILYDKQNDTISGNDGGFKLIPGKRNRNYAHYALETSNYTLAIVFDTTGYNPLIAEASMIGFVSLSKKQHGELARITTTCLSALMLSGGYRFRNENPDANVVLIDKLESVELSFKEI